MPEIESFLSISGGKLKERSELYCLVVSFESLDLDLPVYADIETAIRGEGEAEAEIDLS